MAPSTPPNGHATTGTQAQLLYALKRNMEMVVLATNVISINPTKLRSSDRCSVVY